MASSLTPDQRRGVIADFGRRLALCSDADLRELDASLLEIERRRYTREEREAIREWSEDQHQTRRHPADEPAYESITLGGEA